MADEVVDVGGDKDESHNVRVFVRFRPMTAREQKAETSKEFEVRFEEDEKTVHVVQNEIGKSSIERSYTFDMVFGPQSSQPYVFQHLAQDTVDDVVKGFNGTILAYGQTGSGKTWSMFGGNAPEARGIVPRSAEYLFDELQRSEEISQVTIKCSFLEIYKERLRDLLNPKEAGEGLKIRETPRGAVRIIGLIEEYVSSPDDVINLIGIGEANRTVARTDMNEVSSRSHSLLTITVTQKLQDGSIRVGKLNLADLAGSERVDKSGLVGQTLSEAKKINQSLSSLGNCINALTDRSRTHVPYRDSKLTYLLKDSLGGNTKTCLLVTCSPHPSNSDETLSSLLFANRASHVRNNVRVNRQLSVQELQELVARLRKQLAMSHAKIEALTRGQYRGGPGGVQTALDDLTGEVKFGDMGLPLELQAISGVNTLPTHGSEAAMLYAALGSAMMGGGMMPEDEPPMQFAERNVKYGNSLPVGVINPIYAQNLDRFAVPANYPVLDERFTQGGMGANAEFAQPSEESIFNANTLTIRQRLAAGKMVNGADMGAAGQMHAGALPGNVNPAQANALAGNSALGVGAIDGVTGGAVERAKDTMRRSMGVAHDPLDPDGPTEMDQPVTLAPESDGDLQDRTLAKQRLQEELAAAKKRREDIRAAQRKRADQWASKKGDGPSEGDGANSGPSGDGRDGGAAEKAAKWRTRKDNGLTILTDEPQERQEDDPQQWSPVGSPIPPPPSYPYPVTPDHEVDDPSSRDDSQIRRGAPRKDSEQDASSRRRADKDQAFGAVELRIDLVPDPENPQPDEDIVVLGYIELKQDEDLTLEDFRKRILSELDDVPENFIFTRRSVPIGVRQEKKRTVSYIKSEDDVIAIRLDPSRLDDQ